MKRELEDKVQILLMEIRSSKSTSTVANPWCEINAVQKHNLRDPRKKSMGVHASNGKDTGSEDEDYPLWYFRNEGLEKPG